MLCRIQHVSTAHGWLGSDVRDRVDARIWPGLAWTVASVRRRHRAAGVVWTVRAEVLISRMLAGRVRTCLSNTRMGVGK